MLDGSVAAPRARGSPKEIVAVPEAMRCSEIETVEVREAGTVACPAEGEEAASMNQSAAAAPAIQRRTDAFSPTPWTVPNTSLRNNMGTNDARPWHLIQARSEPKPSRI
jgi:hypothetical protein